MSDVVALTDAEGTFATLHEAFGVDDDSAWWLPFNAFLARAAGSVVLVDSGVGPPGSGDPFLEDRAGRLPALLAAAGVGPADVDLVVFTHLHVDHVGWNMHDGEPFFPRARYVAHRADFDNFTTRYPGRRYVQDQLIALDAAGRLELIDGGFSPLPGVEIEHVPGHTAGSCVVTIGEVVFTGDMAVHERQLADPALGYVFEEDRDAAADVRRRFLSAFAAAGTLLGIPHLGLGRVSAAGEGFAWEPAAEGSAAPASK
jgi:glyoxylase-like metal-dependent hydrolase (beta-lactamase superfamily II)